MSNVIRFFHGNTEDIQERIEAGEINGSDFVVSQDENLLYFVNKDKTLVALGAEHTEKIVDEALKLEEF